MKRLFKTGLVIFIGFVLAGCTFIFQSGRRSDKQKIGKFITLMENTCLIAVRKKHVGIWKEIWQ